jgi:hypothetical protein
VARWSPWFRNITPSPPLRRPWEHSNSDSGRKGNSFDAFTPVAWDSSAKWKGDESLKSLVVTLTNPHSFPGLRFVLKAILSGYLC